MTGQMCEGSMNPSIPPPTTPMCDEARKIYDFKLRLQHYRACWDPRCQARSTAARNLAAVLVKSLKRRKQA